MSTPSQTEIREQDYAREPEDSDAIVVNDDELEPATQDLRPVIVTAPPDQSETEEREAWSEREQSEPRAKTAGGSAYLEAQDSAQANQRWQRIQTEFVDDPRKSVTQAHELVGELTQRIVDAFARERSELERQWSQGDSVSTEDLRVCLQRYRNFFSRLLPSANGLESAR